MPGNSSTGGYFKTNFIQYCIKGLEQAYIPSENVFVSRKLEGGKMIFTRDEILEYIFTMNALLGLDQAKKHGYEIFLDVQSAYKKVSPKIDLYLNSPLHVAATIWTGRSIGAEIPACAMSIFHGYLDNIEKVKNLGPKALAWLIAGCLTGDDKYYENAIVLAKFAKNRYVNSKSCLVIKASEILRANWVSFGDHSYISYALLLTARITGEEWARELGIKIARKIVQLQGKDGQWGWMYHVPSGKLVNFYPVFSVHQYGYAAFFLLEALDQGFEEFREPLIKGFRWILGQNELGKSMVAPEHQVVWRRIILSGDDSKLKKLLTGIFRMLSPGNASIKSADSVKIDYQCHGFEMALPLFTLSGRGDFNEILNEDCFS